MILTTANVNGVRAAARRGGISWLADRCPDVLCLQEVRAGSAQLAGALAGTVFEGWHLAHAPAALAGRAGVAVLTPAAPTAVRVDLAGFVGQGRWLEVDLATQLGPVTVISAYVPTGQAGTVRQTDKYRFLDAMSARLTELADHARTGAGETVLTGDLNIAHQPQDLKNWKGNLGKSGFLPEERAYFDRWSAQGWTDLVRRLSGDVGGPYSWWTWRGQAFDTDTGWRIDYVLATPGLAGRAATVHTGRAASYAERWSDHAAVTVRFS